jgi:hypothetical protein
MKKKMLNKSLVLGKETVVNLNETELRAIQGGIITIGPCAYTVVGCPTEYCPPTTG